MLGLAHDLEVTHPGTKAAFRTGIVSQEKAGIIARATAVLDPAEARAAEALVLGRAGRLTPAGLRSAIARAVIEVAPDKARERREQGGAGRAGGAVGRGVGNAALAGRELPPAEALAADQRISPWARQLKKAGLAGQHGRVARPRQLDLLLGRTPGPARTPQTAGTTPAGRPETVRVGQGQAGRGHRLERRTAGRVRREDQPDDPAGHPARPGRAARRDPRHRPHRPRPGPRPGPRRRRATRGRRGA